MAKRAGAFWDYIRNHLTATICMSLCHFHSHSTSISHSVTSPLFPSSSYWLLHHPCFYYLIIKFMSQLPFMGLLWMSSLQTHNWLTRKEPSRCFTINTMKQGIKIDTCHSVLDLDVISKQILYCTLIDPMLFIVCMSTHSLIHRQMLIQEEKKDKKKQMANIQ